MKNKYEKIGYKLSNNFKCESLTYEVGKEYKISSMEICNHGFHFCENPLDTLRWYDYNKDSVLLKVEALGDIENLYNKSVTNHIKILEVVDTSKIKGWPKIEYDSNNNLIHHEKSDGYEYWNKYEEWKTYDQNNNLVHFKNSNKYEEWKKYDQNNNLVHFKDSNDYEYWKKYDQNNNLIHYKDTFGVEKWFEYEYDSNNNVIYFKDSNNKEYWQKYDENNNLIHFKDTDGIEWSIKII